MNPPLLFVYGTLRRDWRRAGNTGAHQRYLANAEFIGDAWVAGRLYQVSYYPALVPDPSAGPVRGEIYRLPSQAPLIALDEYEECPQPWHSAQEYRRLQLPVHLDSGKQLQAWSYAYQWPVAEHMLIASGDFLAQPQRRHDLPSDKFSDTKNHQ